LKSLLINNDFNENNTSDLRVDCDGYWLETGYFLRIARIAGKRLQKLLLSILRKCK
jgi:hypothetical protein